MSKSKSGQAVEEATFLFYYVCCPVCKEDLSHLVDEEDPQEISANCTYCRTPLRLNYSIYWDRDLGAEVLFFWFEKEENG